MAEVLVIRQVSFEGPARLATALDRAGVDWRLVAADEEPLPATVEGLRAVCLLGGPMGAEDEEDHPFLVAERRLLAAALEAGIGILGICLGAQLLALVAGGRLQPLAQAEGGRVREVGWGPVSFRFGADDADLAAAVPDCLDVVHWHGDTFTLPPGAVHLAATTVCRNQAFRCGRRAFGLQFHLEYDRASLARMASVDRGFLLAAGGQEAPGHLVDDTSACYERSLGARDALLDALIRRLLG